MQEKFCNYIVEIGDIDGTSMSLVVLSVEAAAEQRSQTMEYLSKYLKSTKNKKLLAALESPMASGSSRAEGKVLNIFLFSAVRIDVEENQVEILYQNLMNFASEIRTKKYLFKTQNAEEKSQSLSFVEKFVLFLATPLVNKTRTERVYLGNLLGDCGSNMTSVTVLYDKQEKSKVFIEIDEYQFPVDIFDRMLAKFELAPKED
ncbi:MAG: hypothetical protein DCF19_19405 [Pseudanabaena frigida]|uniref:Uncharacterized protein n=1 Tax=Pseudanabaena frigida TaxID=945775 RepID=A0A2W4XNI2_9CYAN|nr:MAG: hypothetical protein DCF19_19405 [Pseudanabaena frigida]